jgi:hypothetical protein
MQATTLAARQVANLLALIGALEIKAPEIRALRHFKLADLQDVGTVGDKIEDRLVALEIVA